MTKQLGTGELSNVPAAEALPALIKTWAESYVSDPNKEDNGFIPGEQPPAELFNYILNKLYADLNFLKQSGANAWYSNTNYETGNLVIKNGNLFKALIDNVNIDPVLNSSAWGQIALANEVASINQRIIAGAGLIGGGSFAADRTINLGEALTCVLGESSFINEVSHRHAIDIPPATTSRAGIVALQQSHLNAAAGTAATSFALNTAFNILQTALNNHKNSGDHDGRYYTQQTIDADFKRYNTGTELRRGSTIHKVNAAGLPAYSLFQTKTVYFDSTRPYAFTLNLANGGGTVSGTWRIIGGGLDGNDVIEYSMERIA